MRNLVSLSDVREGMIALSGGSEFIQHAIKFFTRSEFSHSFVVVSGPYGILSALETTSTIVSVSDLQHKTIEKDYVQVWEVLQATPLEKLRAAALTYQTYAKTRYGYESYAWFIYRAACRVVGQEPTVMWDCVSRGVTCTELTCFYLCNLNERYRALFSGIDFNTQSPEELRQIMLRNPELFREVGWLVLGDNVA